MYSQERELKKLRIMVRNKARVEGHIAEAFAAREITLFSCRYFLDANNVTAQMTLYHIAEEAPMTDLSAFQWDGKGVGSYKSHLVGMKERNKTLLFLYINMPELHSYFKIFDSIYMMTYTNGGASCGQGQQSGGETRGGRVAVAAVGTASARAAPLFEPCG
jgi:hypothetical protein